MNTKDAIVFDAEPSKRRKDANGFLHVGLSPITKEQVVSYFGLEIPGWEELGLQPTKEYRGYRPADEIQKAAESFNGLPLLFDHHPDSAEAPQKEYRVGSIGTDATWESPYLLNTMTITDQAAIDAVESGEWRQISCAYRYTPDFTPDNFNGEPYDFVMREIAGNHVALVKRGRAGPDVIVSDSLPDEGAIMNIAKDNEAVEEIEVNAAEAIGQLAAIIAGVHETNPVTGELEDMTADDEKNAAIEKIMAVLAQYVPQEQIEAIKGSLSALSAQPAADEDPELAGVAPTPPVEANAVTANPVQTDENPAAPVDPMLKAMGDCGLDSENPDFRKAFAEGMKYGQCKDSDPEDPADNSEPEGAKQAMDSAKIFAEMAERNRLAEQASRFIGNFAYDGMTTKDVAIYVAEKLGLKVDEGQAVTAVNAYMHNRVPQQAFAMDSAGSAPKGVSQVKKFYDME